MNIQKAMKASRRRGWVGIQREFHVLSGTFVVMADEGMLVYVPGEKPNWLIPGWQPSVSELLADDWFPYRITKKNFEALRSREVLKIEGERITQSQEILGLFEFFRALLSNSSWIFSGTELLETSNPSSS